MHSNHRAVATELDLKDMKLGKRESKEPQKRVRIDSSILRQANAYSFKQKVKEIITNLQNEEEMNTPDLHKKFELLIVQSAKEIVEVGVKKHPDWYTQSLLIMSMYIHLCNQAFENYIQSGSDQDHQELKETRTHLQRAKRRVKCKWQEEYTQCKPEDFKESPNGK